MAAENRSQRQLLEQTLGEAVVALRKLCGDGNLTVRVPETGDFVAILQIDEQEATELAELLRPYR
jgi:hypothetical protein